MTAPATRRPRYNTHTNANATRTATLKQRELLAKLYGEYNPLLADSLELRGPRQDTDPAELASIVAELRATTSSPENFVDYRAAQASTLIDNTITAIRRLRAEVATLRRAQTPQTLQTPPAVTEPGLYATPDPVTVYRVKRSRTSGNLYACRLQITPPPAGAPDGTPPATEWVYEGSRPLAQDLQKLTRQMAAAYGQDTGVCCVCGAVLTNPESVAAGIGPICGGRL